MSNTSEQIPAGLFHTDTQIAQINVTLFVHVYKS